MGSDIADKKHFHLLCNSDISRDSFIEFKLVKDWYEIQKEIFHFSIPCVSGNVFKRLQNTVSLLLLGKNTMEPTLIAGVGVGNMAKRLLGTKILYGVNDTIETYVISAVGSGQFKLAAANLIQGRVLACIWFLPLAVILLQTESLLLILGQDT